MAVAAPPAQPATMLVYATEFVLNGSRRAGPSGRWRFQLRNNGQDDHDLRIRRFGGPLLAATPIVHPSTVGTIRVRLAPGRYTLYCGVADHEAQGMVWQLVVRAPKVRATAP
jgi:hypothetical protein